MPEEIRAALTRVAATLPPVDWPEPAQIRRIARNRRRRVSVAATFAAVLLVAGGLGVVRAFQLPTSAPSGPSAPSSAATCPGGLVPAKLKLPEFADIRLQMYNGTQSEGLAANVGGQLEDRGLRVLSSQNFTAGYTGTVLIRYGPNAVGAAWVMQSFFSPDEAELNFELSRADDVVDIVLGTAYQQLATPAQVNRNIASQGRATAPPGTCAAG